SVQPVVRSNGKALADRVGPACASNRNGPGERAIALGGSRRTASRRSVCGQPVADRRDETRRADLEKASRLNRGLHLFYDSPMNVEPLCQVKLQGLEQHLCFQSLAGGHNLLETPIRPDV